MTRTVVERTMPRHVKGALYIVLPVALLGLALAVALRPFGLLLVPLFTAAISTVAIDVVQYVKGRNFW